MENKKTLEAIQDDYNLFRTYSIMGAVLALGSLIWSIFVIYSKHLLVIHELDIVLVSNLSPVIKMIGAPFIFFVVFAYISVSFRISAEREKTLALFFHKAELK